LAVLNRFSEKANGKRVLASDALDELGTVSWNLNDGYQRVELIEELVRVLAYDVRGEIHRAQNALDKIVGD
jgi:hypothetical protein